MSSKLFEVANLHKKDKYIQVITLKNGIILPSEI